MSIEPQSSTQAKKPSYAALYLPDESRQETLIECVQFFAKEHLPREMHIDHEITEPLAVKVVEAYVNNFSKWMDIPFCLLFFKEVLPSVALYDNTGLILSAIKTCGAVYLHRSDSSCYPQDFALTFLNTTTSMLNEELVKPDRCLHRCLIVSVLLNLSTIIFDPIIEHTSHFPTSLSLLHEIKNTPSFYASSRDAAYPFDSQITRYCFWPLVFSDLFVSLRNSVITLWSPTEWGPESGVDNIIPDRDTPWFYFHIFYLLGLANNLVNQRNVPTREELKIDDATHVQLFDKIEEWAATLPGTLRPVIFIEITKGLVFPIICCCEKQQHIMWIAFHAAHILLARRQPKLTSMPNADEQLKHAREIMGILKSCQDRAVWSCTLWVYSIAAPCLRSRKEKSEALSIFEVMSRECDIGIRPEPNNAPARI